MADFSAEKIILTPDFYLDSNIFIYVDPPQYNLFDDCDYYSGEVLLILARLIKSILI